MENSDHDEPDNKKPHLLTPVSSRVTRNSSNHSPNSKNADAGVLQLQNQQLVQQTEVQKQAIQDLEEKTRELKERQNSYDDILITINQHWDQLVDDMALLGIQAGRGKDSLETLDYLDNPQGSLPSCPPDDLLLCRLIQKDSIKGNSNDEITNYVDEALALRRLSTRELLKLIQDTVDEQMERIEDIGQVLHEDLSTEDVIIQMSKIDDMTKKEADNFREVIDTLHAKHKEYTVGIQNYINECSQDQSDIKRLTVCRANIAKWENELNLKLESADNEGVSLTILTRTEELKLQLQKYIIERNDLEIKIVKAKQDIGRKDIKVELRVMTLALSKKNGDMMEEELKRWKDAALEVISLREKANSLRAKLRELDEIVAELEESRRKLVSLKMQKDAAVGMNSSNADAVNGNLSPEKPADRAMGLSELKNSIDEAKIINADRLSELQDAREGNQILTKQFQELQNELIDDKYVRTSRVYSLANEQLQHWIAELDRYKSLTESLQAGRVNVAKREKELNLKLESAVGSRHIHDTSDSRTDELKIQLQKCIIERNDLEIKMEEAKQDTGRKDIKAEFRVMSSALSKEMGMMETQLKRWKDAALEAVSLREKAHSLRANLSGKTSELKSLANNCAQQVLEIKSSKALIEKLQEENQELEFVLDMYGLEDYQKSLPEVRESESKARSQAEMLKNALDEHGLELRVRAANEAEAACEQRLLAAEAEIEELKAQLDATERKKLEMKEAIKVKEAEAETYISEIETIGQAYEDMQTQHQHLLQQVAERDDYNIKLVSESVKAKQLHSTLLSEKQAVADQLQQINSLIENSKKKIASSEKQIECILSEAAKCTQDEKHLADALEFVRWELADAEKELKLLKSVASASEKEYDQIQKDVEAFEKELDSERSSRKKLEEELMEVNNQIAELNSEARVTAVQQLEEEIKVCKNMIKCTVCSDRPKEVVIVKCYHLFCNPCIQRNLELRHRKCPACGTAFGQSDVRFVKI